MTSTTDPTEGLSDLMDITLVRKADKLAAEARMEQVRRDAVQVRSAWTRAVILLHGTGYTDQDLIAAGMPREVVDAVLGLDRERS